ncbi:1,4-alpha-glucan branching protein GlgB [Aquimarina sp. ERC-38]|uniref:1,4-alpha-glucan branching protein GlgB n=1 Tax=Aquimarina sp. ERC-38 TaxID=2949996 RepID=UPI0022466DFD|nr:1,4-alpha-glucan branching protein GlgB [Aquimarina sp. ERC-38]UZO80114.1 1,4-alpha-glucan branching protein GlgB [Aquimarina sp. ERC-38]
MADVLPHSLFTDFDIELFKAGKHYRLFDKFGSHLLTRDGQEGTYFSVWAPNAKQVSVTGDFNYWNDQEHLLKVRWDSSGIWEGFIPGIQQGALYKYKIQSQEGTYTEKADPYARRCEHPPSTASVVWKDHYEWKDTDWQQNRGEKNSLTAPFSVYEVHLPSWRKKPGENRSLSYYELADELVAYLKEMEFTHVEFMPVMEFPYDPSWGYQITGYFAPTSRLGYPEELKYLIDQLHQNGIGIILDWVPSHFPEDAHGLGNFDGSHLYEHPDKRRGYHPDWKSLIFNYGRNEVKSFLISNAIYWLQNYHIDGLRVDAVASMLFLDYSREEGEWEPNIYGGNENLEAIEFLKELNLEVYKSFPDVQMIAEESTSFSGVSKPVFLGGLGFGMKWMMGWMNDTLLYFQKETVYRNYHHNDISFSLTYAFAENFLLPLSHDEVVHGKGSIIGRMPGDEWQQFANLRLLYCYMFTHPGTKLLFMGSEFGQHAEWDFNDQLDWYVLEYKFHYGVKQLVKELNALYKKEEALYKHQFDQQGFEWISYDDHENSVLSYIRKGEHEKDWVIVICNFTQVPRTDYRIGVPKKGSLTEIFNSDADRFAGSEMSCTTKVKIEKIGWQGRTHSASVELPPLAVRMFKIS